eukprot:1061565-Amphidinium_carterae.2
MGTILECNARGFGTTASVLRQRRIQLSTSLYKKKPCSAAYTTIQCCSVIDSFGMTMVAQTALLDMEPVQEDSLWKL